MHRFGISSFISLWPASGPSSGTGCCESVHRPPVGQVTLELALPPHLMLSLLAFLYSLSFLSFSLLFTFPSFAFSAKLCILLNSIRAFYGIFHFLHDYFAFTFRIFVYHLIRFFCKMKTRYNKQNKQFTELSDEELEKVNGGARALFAFRLNDQQ